MSPFGERVPFREEQRFSPLLGIIPATFAGAVALVLFVTKGWPSAGGKGVPVLLTVLIAIAVAVLTAALFAVSKLTVEVGDGALQIRFFPFLKKAIPFSDIAAVESRTYRPLLDYGGWGVRYSLRNGWAYNVRGNRGVQLRLKDGKRILIGSQRPEDLAGALRVLVSR